MAKEKIDSINSSTFYRVLEAAFRAKVPVLAIGHKGIGKSEAVKQFCRDRGLEFIDIRLAYLEAQDIVGFPFRDEKTGKMTFAPPEWLPGKGEGVLFLDEINRARIDVLQAVFQLVRDRTIGGIMSGGRPYELPPGWAIVSAMNPDNDDEQYFVSPVDESLYDRFLKVALEYDATDFISYASKKGEFHKDVLAFIEKSNIDISRIPLQVFVDATPRSIEMFDAIYRLLGEDERDLIVPIGQGLMGPENTWRFIYSLRGDYGETRDLLHDILKSWHTNTEIRKRVTSLREDRNDMIMAVRDMFISEYYHSGGPFNTLSGQELKNYMSFVFALYGEQTVAFLIALKESMKGRYLDSILATIKADPELLQAYEQLVEQNPHSLLARTI